MQSLVQTKNAGGVSIKEDRKREKKKEKKKERKELE